MKLPRTVLELASIIDHTILRPDATVADLDRLCAEAIEHSFHSVCVNGGRVAQACHRLDGSEVKVCTVVGFPLGAVDADVKRYETEVAVDNGAAEIDVVINIGHLKDGNRGAILRELRDVVEAADERIVKVIIETGLLSQDEKKLAGELVTLAEAQFIKTSTGFGPGGATASDVRWLRSAIGSGVEVKASGGIRDLATALALIESGASRLGLSASTNVLREMSDHVRPVG